MGRPTSVFYDVSFVLNAHKAFLKEPDQSELIPARTSQRQVATPPTNGTRRFYGEREQWNSARVHEVSAGKQKQAPDTTVTYIDAPPPPPPAPVVEAMTIIVVVVVVDLVVVVVAATSSSTQRLSHEFLCYMQ